MPMPELRLPQPKVPAPAPKLLLRVSELLTTAVSTCTKAALPPPSSSVTVNRIFEPAASRTRSCAFMLFCAAGWAAVSPPVLPPARTVSQRMLTAPPIVTVVCASAAGAASAAATASAMIVLLVVIVAPNAVPYCRTLLLLLRSGDRRWLAPGPAPLRDPLLQALEVKVDHRRDVERQDLRQQQAPHHC